MRASYTNFHERQRIMKEIKCSECGKQGKEICEECFEKSRQEFMQIVEEGYRKLGIKLKKEKELNGNV